MEIKKFEKKRKIFNYINLLIVILIIASSALCVFLTRQMDMAILLFSIISLVFGFMSLIVGGLLPKKERRVYLSSEKRNTLAIFNLILNKSVVSPSVTKGGFIYRSWHYLGFLIIAVFMVPINFFGAGVCKINNTNLAMKAYILSAILWAVLVLTCGVWTYYDSLITEIIENGETKESARKKMFRLMAINISIVTIIFGSGFLFAYIKQKNENIPNININKIKEEISQAQNKLNELNANDFFVSDEFDSTGEALINIKESHNSDKVYYKLQYTKENTLNVITWSDECDDIFVDCFNVLENDKLKRTKSFVSSAIKKEDVVGKETEIIE